MLPTVCNWVVENLVLECSGDFVLGHCCGLAHIVDVDLTVIVQRTCECFYGEKPHRCVRLFESHRLTHDVGFVNLPSDSHFKCQHLVPEAVKRDKFLVVVIVEEAPFGGESVIKAVQSLP